MCWKAIRTQQMWGFSVPPFPLARLQLSWLHCHQWFTGGPWNHQSGAATFYRSSGWSSFLQHHSLFYIFFKSSYMIRCLRHTRCQNVMLHWQRCSQTCPLSGRSGGGGWNWVEAHFKFNRRGSGGNHSHRTISQQASVVNTSPWKNIGHPRSQMCILNSSSEGSGVGESIHLETIYYISLIGPAYGDGLI